MAEDVKAWMWSGIVVLVAAVAVVTVIAVANSGGTAPSASPAKQQETQQRDDCARDQAVIYFDTDDEMRAAAEKMTTDSQVASVTVATKAQNYQRFLDVFADDQELIDNTRPEAIPASVSVRPVPGVDAETLVDRLQSELPAGAEARSMPCPAK